MQIWLCIASYWIFVKTIPGWPMMPQAEHSLIRSHWGYERWVSAYCQDATFQLWVDRAGGHVWNMFWRDSLQEWRVEEVFQLWEHLCLLAYKPTHCKLYIGIHPIFDPCPLYGLQHLFFHFIFSFHVEPASAFRCICWIKMTAGLLFFHRKSSARTPCWGLALPTIQSQCPLAPCFSPASESGSERQRSTRKRTTNCADLDVMPCYAIVISYMHRFIDLPWFMMWHDVPLWRV